MERRIKLIRRHRRIDTIARLADDGDDDRDLPASPTSETTGIESAGRSATRARELSRYGAAMIHARYVKLVSRRTAWLRNRAGLYLVSGETRPGYAQTRVIQSRKRVNVSL